MSCVSVTSESAVSVWRSFRLFALVVFSFCWLVFFLQLIHACCYLFATLAVCKDLWGVIPDNRCSHVWCVTLTFSKCRSPKSVQCLQLFYFSLLTEGAQQRCEQSEQPAVKSPLQADPPADRLWAQLQWYLPVSSDQGSESHLGHSHLPHQVWLEWLLVSLRGGYTNIAAET